MILASKGRRLGSEDKARGAVTCSGMNGPFVISFCRLTSLLGTSSSGTSVLDPWFLIDFSRVFQHSTCSLLIQRPSLVCLLHKRTEPKAQEKAKKASHSFQRSITHFPERLETVISWWAFPAAWVARLNSHLGGHLPLMQDLPRMTKSGTNHTLTTGVLLWLASLVSGWEESQTDFQMGLDSNFPQMFTPLHDFVTLEWIVFPGRMSVLPPSAAEFQAHV